MLGMSHDPRQSGISGFGSFCLCHKLAASEIRSSITRPGDDSSWSRTLVAAALHGGRIIDGVIRNEDNFSLQLQSSNGTFHLLQKSDNARAAPHGQPLMPTNYSSTLTPAELDDLVGYLMSVAKQLDRWSPAAAKQKVADE